MTFGVLKKNDLSPGKVLEKVLEIFFWKREWTLAFLGKAVSQSLSLHSPSGIGYKLANSKTWWNAEEGGGGNLWWTNILSRRVGRSNSFSCFMLQKLGETLAAMWANAVCIVISQVYDYWKSNFVPKGVFFLFLISSTSEECKASTCSTTLDAHNKAVLHSLRKLITVFNKIDTYIGVLASASKSTVERFTIECYEIKTDLKIITIAH